MNDMTVALTKLTDMLDFHLTTDKAGGTNDNTAVNH